MNIPGQQQGTRCPSNTSSICPFPDFLLHEVRAQSDDPLAPANYAPHRAQSSAITTPTHIASRNHSHPQPSEHPYTYTSQSTKYLHHAVTPTCRGPGRATRNAFHPQPYLLDANPVPAPMPQDASRMKLSHRSVAIPRVSLANPSFLLPRSAGSLHSI